MGEVDLGAIVLLVLLPLFGDRDGCDYQLVSFEQFRVERVVLSCHAEDPWHDHGIGFREMVQQETFTRSDYDVSRLRIRSRDTRCK